MFVYIFLSFFRSFFRLVYLVCTVVASHRSNGLLRFRLTAVNDHRSIGCQQRVVRTLCAIFYSSRPCLNGRLAQPLLRVKIRSSDHPRRRNTHTGLWCEAVDRSSSSPIGPPMSPLSLMMSIALSKSDVQTGSNRRAGRRLS